MAEIASAWVSVLPSFKGGAKTLEKQMTGPANTVGKKTGSVFGKVFAAAGAVAIGGAAVSLFKGIVTASSDAQQSVGATETVFGRFADTVISTSKRAAQQYGLSANEYRENANLLGALFKNQGVSMDQLGVSTEKMIGRAADLAATFGGPTSDAVGALGAAFKGEFDSLERFGISLRESSVSALLAKRGQDDLTGSALAAAKQQAITSLIFQQSKDSLGAFGREANTLAGQQQRLGAQWTNMKATIGTALLPALTSLATTVNTTILPAVRQFGGYLQSNVLPVIQSAAASLAQTLTPAFQRVSAYVTGTVVPALRDLYSWFQTKVVPAVRDALTPVLEKARKAFGDLKKMVKENEPELRKVAEAALRLGNFLLTKVAPIVIRLYAEAFPRLIRAAELLGRALSFVVQICEAVERTMRTVAAVVRATIAVFDSAGQAVGQFAGTVQRKIGEAMAIIRGIPSLARRALAGLGSALVAAGGALIQGLINGVTGKLGELKSKLGEVTSLIPDWKGPATRDAVLLRPAGQLIMRGLVDGIEDGKVRLGMTLETVTQKILDSLKSRRDEIKSVLDGLKNDFASLSSSIASTFAGNLFDVSAIEESLTETKWTAAQSVSQAFMNNMLDKRGELRNLVAAFKKLKGWGMSPAFLSQLFQSGNTPLILEMASGSRAQAAQAQGVFGEVQSLSASLGNQVARADIGPKIDATNRELREIRKALKQQGKEFAQAINGSVRHGQLSAA